jgi:uncharacterized protein
MSNYHEPAEELSAQARDFSRALNSLKEEIEAVDWYHQRVDLTKDEQLKEIMAHNRDEEIEHACMTLEWLRRNMPGWDEELRNYLFKEGDIAHHDHDEHDDEHAGGTDLEIGKL